MLFSNSEAKIKINFEKIAKNYHKVGGYEFFRKNLPKCAQPGRVLKNSLGSFTYFFFDGLQEKDYKKFNPKHDFFDW